MANASYVQSDFRGGQWSPRAQGQVADPNYKKGLNACVNAMPVYNGPWARRSGFLFGSNTRQGRTAKLLPLAFKFSQPFQLELTDSVMRAHFGPGLVFTPETGVTIKSISTANPAVVAVNGILPTTWATGNTVLLDMLSIPCTAPILCNRQFIITVLSTTTFSIVDAMTGDTVDGSTFSYTEPVLGEPDFVYKILELATPYNATDCQTTRILQTDTTAIILHKSYQPQAVTVNGQIAIAAQAFVDGPYLDIPTNNTNNATPDGTSGNVTFVFDSQLNINNSLGFQTTDVGRHFRFQSGPAAWASGTSYKKNVVVTGSDNNIYESVAGSNVGNNPITDDGSHWVLTGQTIVWVWGTITTVNSEVSITVALQAPGTPNVNGVGSTLQSAVESTSWQLGLYSNTTGWPKAGCYDQGRIWLAGGPIPNRFDAGVSDMPFVFSPSAPDGTVGDANAMSEIANATEQNEIYWLQPVAEGVLMGSKAGEWLVRASQLGDPITPTSIQFKRVSKYGSADAESLETELTMCFIQREQKRIMNHAYYPYGETAGWFADDISEKADDITAPQIMEIRWQQEPSHWLWARDSNGMLVGTTFSHAAYGKESYNGWHEHEIAGGRTVESLSTGPDVSGVTTTLYMIALNPTTGWREYLCLAPMFDAAADEHVTNFTDGISNPCCSVVRSTAGGDAFDGITIYGMYYNIGQTVSPVIGGLDLGALVTPNDYVVQGPDGHIDIPFSGAFSLAFIQNINLPEGYGVNTLDVGTPDVNIYNLDAIGGYLGPTTNFSDNDAGQPILIRSKKEFINVNSSGIRRFNSLTFEEIKDATYYQIAFGGAGISSAGLCCYNPDTDAIYYHTSSSNRSPLARVDRSSLQQTAAFGVNDNAESSGIDGLVTAINNIIPVSNGTGSFIVQCGIKSINLNNEIAVVNAGSMQFQCALDIAEANAQICAGYKDTGTFFCLGTPKYGSPATTGIAIYLCTLSSAPASDYPSTNLDMVKVSTITPSEIDATWTHFSAVNGPAFDPTDGNILVFFQTSDSVTQKTYWVKINPNTGAIVWTCYVAHGNAFTQMNYAQLEMPTARFSYLSGTNTITTIDTAAGTATDHSFTSTIATFANQLYYPDRQAMIADVETSITDPIVILGPNGKTFLNNFALCTKAGPQVSADWPPPDQYEVPLSIGLTYESRGQLLRPDYGADAGSADGPAFGKKRRVHWYAAQVDRGQNFWVGTNFTDMDLATVMDEDENVVSQPDLLSGIVSDTLTDNYSFDGQIAWKVNRPTPLTIAAMGGYIASSNK